MKYLILIGCLFLTGCNTINKMLGITSGDGPGGTVAFLIAGQSNAVSGQQWSKPGISTTGRVTSTDNKGFNGKPTADNPSVYNISFIELGDMLSQSFNIDVSLVNVAHGNTSTADWIRAGYDQELLVALRKQHFNAILWVQGESEANQALTPQQTYDNMKFIIEESRRVQPNLKWFVAIDGFKNNNASDAQRRLIAEGIVYQGVNVDTMRIDHPEWFEPGYGGFNGAEFAYDVGFMGHAKTWFDLLCKDQRWLY